jgi:hypothetical protein
MLCTASAGAATVSVRPSSQLGVTLAPLEIVYQAAPGEANRVVIEGTGGSPRWTLSDPGAAVVPGDGCTAIDAHTASCGGPPVAPGTLWGLLELADASLGDGDDAIRISQPAMLGARLRLFADGGPGDDVLAVGWDGGELRGGPGDDRLVSIAAAASSVLDGGGGRDELHGGHGDDTMSDGDLDGATGDAAPGPDVFDGGISGSDTISYERRTAPVSVDLARRAPQGARGEGDRVRRVRNVIGGAGDDRLSGDRESNELDGGGGRDTLAGRDNNDYFRNADGPISCGGGEDSIFDPVAADYARRGCETALRHPEGSGTTSLVYPERVRPRVVGYRVQCPTEEEELFLLWCVGRVTMRQATGGRRRLADGRSRRGRWKDHGFDVALTRLGRRLASRRSGVLSTVTFSVRAHGAPVVVMRWTIRLKVPR